MSRLDIVKRCGNFLVGSFHYYAFPRKGFAKMEKRSEMNREFRLKHAMLWKEAKWIFQIRQLPSAIRQLKLRGLLWKALAKVTLFSHCQMFRKALCRNMNSRSVNGVELEPFNLLLFSMARQAKIVFEKSHATAATRELEVGRLHMCERFSEIVSAAVWRGLM